MSARNDSPAAAREPGMVDVQRVASRVVGEVLQGRNLDRVLESALAKEPNLLPGERAAVHAISFSTLRHLGLLSTQLEHLLSTPLNDAPVRHLLLVALSQLQFSKAAPHTIVDQAVDATRALGFARARGLVNAVLRNYLRAPEKFAREQFRSELARLDFPRWWVERLRAELGERALAVLESAHAQPPMWLRVNRRVTTPEAYLATLAAAGLGVAAQCDAAIELSTPLPVDRLPVFREGLVSVQDLGAQFAAPLLDAEAGQRVLDACAAPGGKTGHLLERHDIELTAIDNDAQRLGRVRDNLARLNLTAHCVTGDAARPAGWWDGRPFDRILVDAPCSGSGVVRRHPDIKWIRRDGDIDRFVRTQAALLNALWACLAPGGKLLYATCSVFEAENGGVVEAFLSRTPDAACIPLAARLDALFRGATGANLGENAATGATDTYGRLLPNHAHDGFFYALLEKSR